MLLSAHGRKQDLTVACISLQWGGGPKQFCLQLQTFVVHVAIAIIVGQSV